MTKFIVGIFAGIVLGGAVAWMILERREGETEHAESEHSVNSRVFRTNDQTFLRLDAETREKMGLKLVTLEGTTLTNRLHATGRVLDPAPLAMVVAEYAVARATLVASEKEFERVQALSRDQNASARALEAATAALQRDRVLADAARLKIRTQWGTPIAEQIELPRFVESLANREVALIRLDLPLGENFNDNPVGAEVALLDSPERVVPATLLGRASTMDPQVPGAGFLCSVKDPGFVPGAAVIGWIGVPGPPRSGVLVPGSAIVRHAGEAFVYLAAGTDLFSRQRLLLQDPTREGWFVQQGCKPGDALVVVGAQQLLSEEFKGEPEEEE